MNLAGARLARQACDERTDGASFVAGSIGPLNQTLSLSPNVDDPAYRAVTFDEVREGYAEQMRGLVDGGVDLLLIETIFDTLNAKAAIAAAREVFEETGVDLPLWISVTIVDRRGRTLSGQTIEAFWTSVEHASPLDRRGQLRARARRRCGPTSRSSRGSRDMLRQLLPERRASERVRRLRRAARTTRAGCSREFAEAGLVNVVGGCCGTTPEHIRAIAARRRGPAAARRARAPARSTRFSGLEPFTIHRATRTS